MDGRSSHLTLVYIKQTFFIVHRFEGTLFGGEPENQALEKLLQAFMNHIKCIGMEVRMINCLLACWQQRWSITCDVIVVVHNCFVI